MYEKIQVYGVKMFIMGESGTANILKYKGKLPVNLNEDIFNDTYDQKQLFNFTGATSIHQIS
jgi:hypothetical protein